MYTIKVNTIGTKIAVYDSTGQLVKVVNSSESTFKPFEARAFAEGLFKSLNAMQMTDPSAPPSVTTPGELKEDMGQQIGQPAGPTEEVIEESQEEPVGDVTGKYTSLEEENTMLKAKLDEIQKATIIERKARRGLAIAKIEVDQGKLASIEDEVEKRVAQIASLEDVDIERLERKIAGFDEFETSEDAKKYASKMRIKARNLQEDAVKAFKVGNEEEATISEIKASECISKANEAVKIAEEIEAKSKKSMEEDEEEDEDDEVEAKKSSLLSNLINAYKKIADIQIEISKEAKDDKEVVQAAVEEANEAIKKAEILLGKKAQDDEEEIEEECEVAKKAQEEDDDVEECEVEGKKKSSIFVDLVDAYKKVAELQESIAKKAEGDNEVVQAAIEEAKEAKEKMNILIEAQNDDEEIEVEEEKESKKADIQLTDLIDAYKKISELHKEISKDAELDGQEHVAEAAIKEAEEAEKKAEILFEAQKEDDEEETQEDEEENKESSLEEMLFMATDVVDIPEIKEAQKEDDEEEKEKEASTKIAAIKKHSDGVNKIAKIEQNSFANNTVIDNIDLESLWRKETD